MWIVENRKLTLIIEDGEHVGRDTQGESETHPQSPEGHVHGERY
jgi:hypothetical protein